MAIEQGYLLFGEVLVFYSVRPLPTLAGALRDIVNTKVCIILTQLRSLTLASNLCANLLLAETTAAFKRY